MPSCTRRLLPLVLATTATQASIVVLAPLLVEIARDLGGTTNVWEVEAADGSALNPSVG